jgi:hypothetical protein
MTVIATYETQVADLLHDPANVTWSTPQLARYINEARRQLVMDTGCLRVLQTVVLTQGVEVYSLRSGALTGALITAGGTGYVAPTVSFAGGGVTGVAATLGVTSGAVTSISFSNFGSGYTIGATDQWVDVVESIVGPGSGATLTVGAIDLNTYDVLDVHVYWGNERYRLNWRPWSVFSMQMRAWVGLQQRPIMWAVYGDNRFYVGPLPDQAYQVDLDTVILPADISGVTVDPISPAYQDPIKFYAAHLAKINQQMYGEAATFKKLYFDNLADKSSAYVRRVPNPYDRGGGGT